MHNKKQIPLLNFLVNCISARSAPQILSIKGQYTLRFSNFPVSGFCNSSANSHIAKTKGRWFDLISFLTAPKEGFLSKNF